MADEEGTPTVNLTALRAEIASRASQVDTLLAKKDKINALNIALQNPPVASKSDELKEANTAIIEKVLSQFTEADISNAVNSLSVETLDVLMKYIYKFMSKSSNCPLMLKLHAQVTQKAGVGSIVRVLTDRKQV